MLKIGHRGASGLAPENTRAAFEKAIDYDLDMIELDVQLSKDGYERLSRTVFCLNII